MKCSRREQKTASASASEGDRFTISVRSSERLGSKIVNNSEKYFVPNSRVAQRRIGEKPAMKLGRGRLFSVTQSKTYTITRKTKSRFSSSSLPGSTLTLTGSIVRAVLLFNEGWGTRNKEDPGAALAAIVDAELDRLLRFTDDALIMRPGKSKICQHTKPVNLEMIRFLLLRFPRTVSLSLWVEKIKDSCRFPRISSLSLTLTDGRYDW